MGRMGTASVEGVLADDLVLPFSVPTLGVRGRVARLGPVAHEIISAHAYPPAVSRLLGEALALTALLGSNLKFDGRFILQTQSDGPVSLLVTDYDAPGLMRGYVRFDEDRLAQAVAQGDEAGLLGNGHLAFTIDQGADMQRYQGVVPLEDTTLSAAALTYFRQSEQIPTLVRLAAAESFVAGAKGRGHAHGWRAGGILLQHLPPQGGEPARPFGVDDEGAGSTPFEETGAAWEEAAVFMATVEDHELLDPTLSPERLLYRLFHERGVRVMETARMGVHCRCSRERVEGILRQFGPAELDDMIEDGVISATCEFCNRSYRFTPEEIG